MIIYEAINFTNHKRYIGQTTQTLEQRIGEHVYDAFNRQSREHFIFYRALRKYGKDNFKWRVIGYCRTKRQLDTAERACISFYLSNNPIYGYNNTEGGTGGAIRKGMKNSEEHKLKIGASMKKVVIGPERREIQRQRMSGKKLSEETKKRMSESHKGQKPRLGMKASQETRSKMSESRKGNTNARGKHWKWHTK